LVWLSAWLLLSAGRRNWLGRSETFESHDWPAALWSGFFVVFFVVFSVCKFAENEDL
jgi:hypothetical protein